MEHLGYDWQEVHDEAERLEHAVSDGFTWRLAELLGHPDHDPHGDPIPSAEGTLEVDDSFTLSWAVAGQRLRISKVRDEDAAMLDYLGERNLVPGRWLSIREVRALDGVVIVEDEEGNNSDLFPFLHSSLLLFGSPRVCGSIATLSLAALYQGTQVRHETSYPFTGVFGSSPERTATIFCAARAAILSRVSMEALPMCGASTTFSSSRSFG